MTAFFQLYIPTRTRVSYRKQLSHCHMSHPTLQDGAELLGKMGYRAVRGITSGVRLRGWLVYQRDTEEINKLKKLLKD